jgi:hypothetical protein
MLVTIAIAIIMLSHWFTRGKLRKVIAVFIPIFNRKPLTCTKCLVFWISLITFASMGEYYYILPTFVLAVIYNANYY